MRAEWWMLPPDFVPQGRLDVTLDADEGDPPPFQLAESWCGSQPSAHIGPSTSCFGKGIFAFVRHAVAGGRHRYQKQGYDLDLAYITSRVIAMSFPGGGSQDIWRNPRKEVIGFLNRNHKDSFKVYNLCREKKCRQNGFPDETVEFPCSDHCPPDLPAMLAFCREAERWLRADDNNVIAVHCKAGKGRTGCMISALLVYAGAAPSAYHALRFYEWARGGQRSGVTIPAQIRWAAMMERWLKSGDVGLRCDPMALGSIVPHRLLELQIGPFRTEMFSIRKGERFLESIRVGLSTRESVAKHKVTWWNKEVSCMACGDNVIRVSMPLDCRVWQEDDGRLEIRIRLRSSCYRLRSRKLRLQLWWHYAFLREEPAADADAGKPPILVLEVGKPWVDGLQRDLGTHKIFPEEFRIVAAFTREESRTIAAE